MIAALALLLAQLAGTPGQIQTPNAGRWTSQQGTFLQSGTGATLRTIEDKERDWRSAKDYLVGGVCNAASIASAITAAGATGSVYIPSDCADGAYTNPNTIDIIDLRTSTALANINTPNHWWRRTDTSPPVSGAGILNPYLAPILRLDMLMQSGGVTGSTTGFLIYAPGVKGKTTTTFTAPVTLNASPQSVAVADSSVFAVNDVANVDLNQGSAKSEDVTITAIADSTHVTGVFTKNHASGAKLFVVGKGDKIGFGCAMADSSGNTNNVFCENLNVTAVAGAPTNSVVASEIDVTNSTGSAPGRFPGDTAPNLTGIAIETAGANDSTNAIGIGTAVGGIGWTNGIQIESARTNGISISNGAGFNVTNGIAVQAAGTNGVVIGSNQTAASNPNFSLADPTTGVLLTSRGTSGSVASNTVRMQELIASVSHTMDEQLLSAQWRWSYDGTWQGAAVNSDGSVQTQKTFQLRNSSNSTIASWDNQSGNAVLTNSTWVSGFPNPSTTGTFRLVSGEAFNIRNNANNADLNLLSKTTGDVAVVGAAQGIQAVSVRSGSASNTDLAGTLTAAAGVVSYSFTQTYTSAPICVCSDTTATVSGCNVTAASTASVSFKVTGATDTLNYICHGRN